MENIVTSIEAIIIGVVVSTILAVFLFLPILYSPLIIRIVLLKIIAIKFRLKYKSNFKANFFNNSPQLSFNILEGRINSAYTKLWDSQNKNYAVHGASRWASRITKLEINNQQFKLKGGITNTYTPSYKINRVLSDIKSNKPVSIYTNEIQKEGGGRKFTLFIFLSWLIILLYIGFGISNMLN